MIGHAYVKLYLSRMFVYLMHVCTSKTSAIARKRKITNLSLQRSNNKNNNKFIVPKAEYYSYLQVVKKPGHSM